MSVKNVNQVMEDKSPAQIFTEATGGCWKDVIDGVCERCGTVFPTNPTYQNAADILRRMKEFLGEEEYEQFISGLSFVVSGQFTSAKKFIRRSFISFIDAYILNAPAMLDKAIEYLENGK